MLSMVYWNAIKRAVGKLPIPFRGKVNAKIGGYCI